MKRNFCIFDSGFPSLVLLNGDELSWARLLGRVAGNSVCDTKVPIKGYEGASG